MLHAGVLTLSLFMAANGSSTVSVEIDSGFALGILDEICSGRDIDEQAIRESPVVGAMVEHFAAFRADFSMDTYIEARRLAARCKVAQKDIYRFGEVIERRLSLIAEIGTIKQNEAEYSEAIASMLREFTPADVSYAGSAVLVVGGPSCGGWSNGAAFYVDVPCMKGDERGLQYLIAHETYHAIQNAFMPIPPKQPALESMLDATVREGTAMVVADFKQIDQPGSYSELSLRVISNNERRMAANFDLFDVAASYLHNNDNERAAQAIDTIGFSGFYESPFYAIGAHMTRKLDQALGRAALLCLMATPSAEFLAAYAALPASLADFSLGENVNAGIQSLRTDASRAQADACRTESAKAAPAPES